MHFFPAKALVPAKMKNMMIPARILVTAMMKAIAVKNLTIVGRNLTKYRESTIKLLIK